MNWFVLWLVISWIFNIIISLYGLSSARQVWASSSSYAIGAACLVIYAGLLLATSTPLTWFGVALILYWTAWFVAYVAFAILGGMRVGTKTFAYELVANIILLILMTTVGVTA